MKRWLNNFYFQIAAAYAVAAAVLGARVILFPARARVLLSPLYGRWEPRATWWLAAALPALAACVAVALKPRRRAALIFLTAAAIVGCVVVNVAPGGWHALPFLSYDLFVHDARWLYENANVFRDYAALTAAYNQHCRVRPGMTYWLLGLADRLGGGNAVAVELMIIGVAALAVPLTALGARAFVPARDGYTAAALFALSPSFLVYGSAPDGFYAVAGAAAIALIWHAFKARASLALAAAAGALVAFCLLTSYTLIAVLLFLFVAAAFLAAVRKPRARPLLVAGVATLTAAATLILFQLATGYDHYAVFRRAFVTAQQLAPGGDNLIKMATRWFTGGPFLSPETGKRPYGIWVVANLFSFFLILGVPTAVLYGRELRRLLKGKAWQADLYGTTVVAFLVSFLAANLGGFVLGEVERVWLFLVGGFAVPAAVYLQRLCAERRSAAPAVVTFAVLAAQAAAYHMLVNQPF